MTRDEKPDSDPSDILNLDPLHITSLIRPVQTPGADGGINYNIIHSNEEGLLVQLLHYLNMQTGDWIQVFWGDDDTPVVADTVLPEQVGAHFPLYVPTNRIPEGVHDLYATVTRSGGGNGGSTLPLSVLVRTVFPGGTDPAPDEDGHQNLLAPEPELPPSGIIDEEAAKNGVKVTIAGYPNMREFDRITLSWGGELLVHEVTQAEVDAGSVDILVGEATILAAGADENLILVYRVRDEVHNISSDWSIRTLVTVEVGEDLFDAPWIENPDPDADPYEVIHLDDLGDNDLLIDVMVYNNGLLVGDVITLTWTGTTAQGLPVVFTPEPQTVTRPNQALPFIIPNGDVRVLGGGRGMASYTVSRDGAAAGRSKRAFVSFIGAEQRLPKPELPDAVAGVLDPTLASTSLVVPGDALAGGDTLHVTWLGTRADGRPLLREFTRGISSGNAGKPVTLAIDGETLLAPLDGGSVTVYYKVVKGDTGVELPSEHERALVGEARGELPAPSTRPPADNGVLDPAEIAIELEIVIPHWPGMQAEQTVHLSWKASNGQYHNDSLPISPGMVGDDVVFYMDRTLIDTFVDMDVELSYRIESPGQPALASDIARFRVGAREGIGDGSLRVMGARWEQSYWRSAAMPRMISALDEDTLAPALAQWRYEDDSQWTSATHWFDSKPHQKLYVRSGSETWECRPLNIVGNGTPSSETGWGSFAAIRDETDGPHGPVTDLVVWGPWWITEEIPDHVHFIKNVAQVASAAYGYAILMLDGKATSWGGSELGHTPELDKGGIKQISGSENAFVAQKDNGELYGWGYLEIGMPIPDEITQYNNYVEVLGSREAFAARRASGHIVAWGSPNHGGQLRDGHDAYDDIVQLAGNFYSFAALRDDRGARSVIAWGNENLGGLIPSAIARLTNVKRICASTSGAFCIQLETGELKAWPVNNAYDYGGKVPTSIGALTNAVEVAATGYAFCARLSTGKVVAWGHDERGGKLPRAVADRTDIVQVIGNFHAFAALCSDGSVVAWGEAQFGGDTSKIAEQLQDVRAIYSNISAFTALTKDGRVVTWGQYDGGGNSDEVQPELEGKVTAQRRLSSDEAAQVNAVGVTEQSRN